MIEELIIALANAQQYVCSMTCPSIKYDDKPWLHSNECKAITELLIRAQQKTPSNEDGT